MALFPPQDVADRGQRKWAWAYFCLLILAFLGFTIAIFVTAFRKSKNLPTSLALSKDNVLFPDIEICQRITQTDTEWQTFVRSSYSAWLRCNFNRTAIDDFPFPLTIQNATMETSTGLEQPTPFTYNLESNVPAALKLVPKGVRKYDPAWSYACAVIKSHLLVGGENDIPYDEANLFCYYDIYATIGLPSFLYYLAKDTKDGREVVMGMMDNSYYDQKTQISSRLELTEWQYLNGTTGRAANFVKEDSWNPTNFAPGKTRLSLHLDPKGELRVIELWPISYTSVIGQVLSAWAAIGLMFGVFFPRKDVRYFLITRKELHRQRLEKASLSDLYSEGSMQKLEEVSLPRFHREGPVQVVTIAKPFDASIS